MSRRAEVADFVVTINTLDDLLLVPAGHKYELTGIACNTDSSAAVTFLVLRHSAGGYFGRDEATVASGHFITRRDYELMTFLEGDYVCIWAMTAGTPGVSVVIDYIDVDF